MHPRRLTIVVLLIAGITCSACAVPAGVAISSAAGSAPVVAEGLGTNSPDTFWVATFDDVVEAAKLAGDKLTLTLVDERIEDNYAALRFADLTEEQVILRIERRSETVTRVRFVATSNDVRGLAQLLGRQIVDELQDANAFLVDWTEDSGARNF